MDLGLADRVVLITGSGQGIGRAIGQAFAGEGARVAFHYHRSGEGAEQAVAEAEAAGASAMAVGADITDEAAVGALVDAVTDRLGPVDVLVNNAAATQSKPFLDSTPSDWAPQIGVTVTGTLLVTHRVLRSMVPRGRGSIVNILGDSGRVGESRLLVTATARGSMIGFTKSLAKEFAADGIRANAVSLGLVRSENLAEHTGHADPERMERIRRVYPLGRLGVPDDIPPTILLLASDRSSWTTGQIVSVNGGYAMP